MTGVRTETPAAARPAAAAVALCAVQFVDVLGVTVVVTALPRMLADLGASTAQGTAVVTAYAMFFGGLLMLAARVGDRVGHRRVVLAALALFAGASALGALAPSVWPLAASRALQGVAAAASVPAALRLLTTVVPAGPARRRAVAGWSAAGAAAGAAGFLVGGLLTELASWRAVFWGQIVLAAVVGAAVWRAVPRDRAGPAAAARIGWPSSLLLVGGTTGLVTGTTLLGEGRSVPVAGVATALGALAAAAFVVVERRTRRPLVARAAWRAAELRWGAVGSFANTAATSSSITVATLYLQGERGLAPLEAAGVLATVSVLAVVGSVLAPRVVAVLGWGGAVGAGLAVVAAGNALFAAWPQVLGVGVASGLCGLGLGVSSVAANDMGTAVAEDLRATAAGVLNTAAQLGTAIGTAVVLLVATLLGARPAWVVAAVLAGGVALAAARAAPSDRTAPSGDQHGRRP